MGSSTSGLTPLLLYFFLMVIGVLSLNRLVDLYMRRKTSRTNKVSLVMFVARKFSRK